jgi:hypothetical protein
MNTKPQTKIIRQDWAKSFQEMANNQDDKLLDEETATDWDNQEWDWEEIELK